MADAAVDAADTELARRKLDGWFAVFNGGKRDEILAFREPTDVARHSVNAHTFS